jgi:serine/threonine protein kinase
MNPPLNVCLVLSDFTIDMSDLSLGEKFAEGGFGEVFSAKLRGNPDTLAVKRQKVPEDMAELMNLTSELSILRNEVSPLIIVHLVTPLLSICTQQKLCHPNLVKYHGACLEDQNVFIVMELCKNGSLEDQLQKGLRSVPVDYCICLPPCSACAL